MRIGRITLSLLVALALAMLPVAASDAFPAKSSEMAGMVPDVSPSGKLLDDAMFDCCPHQTDPGGKSMDDNACLATCVVHCFGFAQLSSSAFVFPPTKSILVPATTNDIVRAETGSPPFRPPRA
jgi:hypothetical protein